MEYKSRIDTGFKDRYGKKIYEGDILLVWINESFEDMPQSNKSENWVRLEGLLYLVFCFDNKAYVIFNTDSFYPLAELLKDTRKDNVEIICNKDKIEVLTKRQEWKLWQKWKIK